MSVQALQQKNTFLVTELQQRGFCDVAYLLSVLCQCSQSGLYLSEPGVQLTDHLTLRTHLRNLRDKRLCQ